MNLTIKQKLLLAFLLAVTIVLFTTYYKYPWHPDHYTLGQYTYALIEHGYAPWILSPISLFGYYPLSIPSGFEYFFAFLYNISSIDLGILFNIFSVISALFAVTGVYLVMREFLSFEKSFLTAFILATSVYFVKNVSNTASSRMFNIIFYPLFILILFKLYKLYNEEQKISIKYIASAILLFVLMNLIHRFGQLLLVFLISFFSATVFENYAKIFSWINKTKLYDIRMGYYNYSQLYMFLDIECIILLLFSFKALKIKLLWLFLAFIMLTHYVWFDCYKSKQKFRSENLLVLDGLLLIMYVAIGKLVDLGIRGRILANLARLGQEYAFQLTIVGAAFAILASVSLYLIIKKFKSIRAFSNLILTRALKFLREEPEKLIPWILLLMMLFLISRNFTGDNFYRYGLDHYTNSFILKGNSPWIIMVNFMFNLNNNVTILIYFAIVGVLYTFLKENKTFYDYFFIFVAIGFSQFLLDWEYVRLYILPIYAIFMGIGLVYILQKLYYKTNKNILFALLTVLFIVHLIFANIFIQREEFLSNIGGTQFEEPIPERYYISAGSFLQNKGEMSIHTSSSIDYDRKTAYYSKKVISVVAESVFINLKDYQLEQASFNQIIDDFKQGKKVRQIASLKDPIFGSYYYQGRHISYLNGRSIIDSNVRKIISLYKINYVVDGPGSTVKTNFFNSVQPIKNKIYSSGQLDIYEISGGR